MKKLITTLVFVVACKSSSTTTSQPSTTEPQPSPTPTEPAPTTPPPTPTTPEPTPEQKPPEPDKPPTRPDPRPSAPPKMGENCGSGDSCGPGLTCVSYYGVAGARGPQFKTCEVKCDKKGAKCPDGTKCVTVADGPGQVCRRSM